MQPYTYADKNLKKIWLGYITVPGWVIFIPADGGKPLVFEEVE